MALGHVQTKVSATAQPFSDSTETVTWDGATQAGNYVIIGISIPATNRTISSVTDSAGNTYALLSQGGTDATTQTASVETWLYGGVQTSGATTFTVATGGGNIAATAHLWGIEISGQHATTPVEDVVVTTTTTTTTHDVGDVVTAAAGSLLVGIAFTSGSTTFTQDADYTTIQNAANGISGYDLVGAATSDWTPTSSGNVSCAMVLVAIQPASSLASVPVFVHHGRQQGYM